MSTTSPAPSQVRTMTMPGPNERRYSRNVRGTGGPGAGIGAAMSRVPLARVGQDLLVLAAHDAVRARADLVGAQVAGHEDLVEVVVVGVLVDLDLVRALLHPPRDVVGHDVDGHVQVVALLRGGGEEAAAAQGQLVRAVAGRGQSVRAVDGIEVDAHVRD